MKFCAGISYSLFLNYHLPRLPPPLIPSNISKFNISQYAHLGLTTSSLAP